MGRVLPVLWLILPLLILCISTNEARRYGVRNSTPRCRKDTDCYGGEICQRNYCERAECRRSSDCNGNKRCRNGRCVTVSRSCRKDRHCSKGYICSNYRCKPWECRRDRNCPSGEICRKRRCVDGCRNTNDCPRGYKCRRNKCVQKRCTRDRECDMDQTCQRGRCVDNEPTNGGNVCPAVISDRPPEEVRLPSSLEPKFYTVEVQPDIYGGDPNRFAFSGSVKILMLCKVSTRNITLHVRDLNIDSGSVKIMEVGGNTIEFTSMEEDTKRQFLIFHLDTMLRVNREYTIEISFDAPLLNDLAGVFYTSYKRGNETVFAVASLFESSGARSTFPCFDEPARKARFDITILRKRGFRALSNMPRISSENRGNGWIADKFKTTLRMSTYLLAFIVSDFTFKKTVTENNVLVRGWARKEAISQAEFGTQTCANILTAMEKYFDVRYPKPKLDNFPVPDYLGWAMENWGIITYRERTFLYDPEDSSEVNRQRVAYVISHELIHKWFGDLVTHAWWGQLWLKESFATVFQYVGVDLVFPEWKFLQIIVEDIHLAFGFDSLMTSRPMTLQITTTSEADNLFDDITYEKGASVLRMMNFFLGERVWQRGLSRFLKKFSFRNANQDDLWSELSKEAIADGGPRSDVKTIMETWTNQMNYPVVTVTRIGNDRVRLSQKRFLRLQGETLPVEFCTEFGHRYEIPFTYTTSYRPDFDQTFRDITWLSQSGQSKTVRLDRRSAEASWILGNIQLYGYFRTNYDESNWRALIRQLNTDHTVIHLINRAQIINDAFNLAISGDVRMEIALRTVDYLDREREFVPWSAAVKEFTYIANMLERSSLNNKVTRYMKEKLETTFRDIGFDNTGATHQEGLLRSLISETACSFGVKSCVDESVRLFRKWMNRPSYNPIDASVRLAVYCTAIRVGGAREWNFAFRQYRTTNSAHELSRLLSALACSQNRRTLRRLMRLSLNNDVVRKHDVAPLYTALSNNPKASLAIWNFVRRNWPKIFENNGFSFAVMITQVTKKLNTETQLRQLEDFISRNVEFASNERAFKQAVEKTKINIKWLEDHFSVLKKELWG